MMLKPRCKRTRAAVGGGWPLAALAFLTAFGGVAAATRPARADDPAETPLARVGDREIKADSPRDSAEAKQNRDSARELSRAFRNAAARTVPSVVTIKVRTREAEGGGVIDIVGGSDSSFDGLGSGVIISEDGLVLTNHHVIKGAKHTEVMLIDGRQFTVHDVKSDPPSDLAILRIDVSEKLPVAPIGNSKEINVGDWVLAIGSPFSLDSTVSAGIISGKNRRISDLVTGRVLQTDAAVNPGNSGGPLIDLDGKVVGINTAISSSSGSFQGIGFAIPVHRAMWVKNELLEHGHVRHARMGAQLGSIPLDVVRQLELPANAGAYVVSTIPDLPADKAGLLPGDIVAEFDHQHVANYAELGELVAISPIGQTLEMTILRSGEKKTLQITLEARK
jgi:serine protease Do